jgi:3-deoxy-D-manno-octulosonic-acid transferase
LLILYRIFFVLAAILGSPYLLMKALWGHHGVTERLGFVPIRQSQGPLFWFHAASMGELKILSAVIPELKRLSPSLEIAISTTTATGKRRARELFGEGAIVFLQPLEINSAILRTIERIKPQKLILVETEIWPLLISTSADCGLEVDLINARMSTKSFRVYRWFKPFIGKAMRRFSHVLARTEADADRFKMLGAFNPKAVGNIKYDQVLAGGQNRKPAIIPVNQNKIIFVAGSIRRGEDVIFADLISSARDEHQPVFFIMAPRHMKDLGELRLLLESGNIPYQLWTETRNKTIDTESVLIVNTMGELINFYLAADLTFVGGSLVPIGGHDPAEPAALGKPVLFGPYMDNAGETADLLVKSGGAQIVKGKEDLLKALCQAVSNKPMLIEKGEKCRQAILSMSGISEKIARIIGDK